ncbi:MAG: DUF493 domain-containing protein [gamma proteobacterium symbiont of Bathyaustriella thionipta]|nr:DUF493 domain-containing protein [gamma proteobacterium symbiont of Bathyaustriella thionipta]
MSETHNSDELFQFPCEFPIKVMGKDEDNFEQLVIELVCPHAPEIGRDALHSRPSKGGKYLAVTVTLYAQSRTQLDAIYNSLSQHKRVLMAL